jgi:uncharacterized repeat protein (TIGR02543 family)
MNFRIPMYLLFLLAGIGTLRSCSSGLDPVISGNTFGISYDANGGTNGTVPKDENRYASGKNVVIPGNTGGLKRSGYDFSGWNTKADGSGDAYKQGSAFSMPDADVTFYAIWTPFAGYMVSYICVYRSKGWEPEDYTIYRTGETATVLGNTRGLERSGYFFSGWNTKPDGSGDAYRAGDSLVIGDADILLWAIWTALPRVEATLVFERSGAGYRIAGLTGPATVLVIPTDHDGLPIMEIGDAAFKDCDFLSESITIPDGVVSIGANAFAGCYGFSGDLIIPDSVTTIGDYAFDHCVGLNGRLGLSKNLTALGTGCFAGCLGLTGDLAIPESLTIIGSLSFSLCYGFQGSLSLPDGVQTIGSGAFSGCSGFTGSLNLPSGTADIGNDAFSGCHGFTGALVVPANVTGIAPGAFAYCSGFSGDLVIPDGVSTIHDWAFYGCSGIASITCDSPSPPALVYDVGLNPFDGMSALAAIRVPETSVNAYRQAPGWNDYADKITAR